MLAAKKSAALMGALDSETISFLDIYRRMTPAQRLEFINLAIDFHQSEGQNELVLPRLSVAHWTLMQKHPE